MELFHKYRNKSMMAFTELAERIANGEIFSKNEFENEYYRLSGDRFPSVFYRKVMDNERISVFDTEDKKRVKLSEMLESSDDITISDILLKTEEYWLCSALSDNLAGLFLSDDEIRSVKEKFSDCPQYYRNIDDHWRKGEDISESTAADFRTILHAINSKKSLSYTCKGKKYIGTPIRIEYDERTCRIYMILYNGDRFIKSDISGLSDIEVTDGLFENIPEITEEMLGKQAYRPVVFTVSDKKNRNAIERALLAFSVYDHIAEPLDEKTVRFTIQYYTMDLDILIKDILSFGADIKVESPKFVVKKIIEIIEKF